MLVKTLKFDNIEFVALLLAKGNRTRYNSTHAVIRYTTECDII